MVAWLEGTHAETVVCSPMSRAALLLTMNAGNGLETNAVFDIKTGFTFVPLLCPSCHTVVGCFQPPELAFWFV
jgi:hypothetical protein